MLIIIIFFCFSSPTEEDVRPEEEMADLLQKSLHQMGPLQVTTGHREDGEFEMVTPRPRLMDNLPSVQRSEPLCQLDWELHFDDQGKLLDLTDLKQKVFRGGVEPEIRNEVWKFLLGFYAWDSTTASRQETRKRKVDDYHRMKMQWKSITEDQESRFMAFHERKSQIEKDVGRTDRTHPFFEGDDNPNVQLLQDILMTYVMYNFDLGYVQGMSDLLAPILSVMENEVDAFWCFAGFMRRVQANFDFDQGGIKKQLQDLTDIIKVFDPDFYAYLDTRDSGNLFFCFRWLLIWFKRELAFNDVMRLWEVIWSDHPCPNFHLLVCTALMENERPSIVENKFGFSEILKHINDLSHRIDLDAVLKKAEAIWIRANESNLPNNVRSILGIPLDQEHPEPAATASVRPPSSASIEVIEEPTTSECSRNARSKPMAIRGRERRRNDDNCGSLNESSSVEVLSPMDDEEKFEQSLVTNFL